MPDSPFEQSARIALGIAVLLGCAAAPAPRDQVTAAGGPATALAGGWYCKSAPIADLMGSNNRFTSRPYFDFSECARLPEDQRVSLLERVTGPDYKRPVYRFEFDDGRRFHISAVFLRL